MMYGIAEHAFHGFHHLYRQHLHIRALAPKIQTVRKLFREEWARANRSHRSISIVHTNSNRTTIFLGSRLEFLFSLAALCNAKFKAPFNFFFAGARSVPRIHKSCPEFICFHWNIAYLICLQRIAHLQLVRPPCSWTHFLFWCVAFVCKCYFHSTLSQLLAQAKLGLSYFASFELNLYPDTSETHSGDMYRNATANSIVRSAVVSNRNADKELDVKCELKVETEIDNDEANKYR